MRNHTLMQTIARANRVLEISRTLIVDVGVFKDLEKALAIYGSVLSGDRRRTSCKGREALEDLREAVRRL